MEKPISLTVTSAQTRAEIRDTITAGDSEAYPLSITFSDLTAITGTVRFRFVRGDAYWDRDATVAANVASLMLEPAFYAATGTELWVSFEDSNLYTPLHVYFRDIRVPGGNVEVATSQTYPAWVAEVQEAEEQRELAEGAREEAYTVAEQGRDDSYAAQEIVRDGLYDAAETSRYGLYATAEQGRDSQYATAEQGRDGQYSAAESARDDLYDAQEIVRDGQYSAAESARDDLYAAAEGARAVWEAYNPLTTYEVGNKVFYDGSSYICHTASTGNLPTNTDYWAIIAQKGDAGPNAVTTTTATDLTGVIAGDGTNIRAATAADGDSLPVTGGTLGAKLSAIDTSNIGKVLDTNGEAMVDVWIGAKTPHAAINPIVATTLYLVYADPVE